MKFKAFAILFKCVFWSSISNCISVLNITLKLSHKYLILSLLHLMRIGVAIHAIASRYLSFLKSLEIIAAICILKFDIAIEGWPLCKNFRCWSWQHHRLWGVQTHWKLALHVLELSHLLHKRVVLSNTLRRRSLSWEESSSKNSLNVH